MRKSLPNRRESFTIKLVTDGVTGHITVSPPREVGPAQEVFIAGAQAGSQIDHILHDVAVIISIALQHGIEPTELAKSVTRTNQNNAHSIVGAVVDLINRGQPLAVVEEE